ncbi:MAG: O-antigen ligase family protein, partial [bacterium]|nr:O-antigen ligase family protein [bacterium]
GEGRLENKSTSERLVSYQESWQMIKKTPAFGVGLGNYTYALNRQAPGQPADAKALARRESFYYQPTHNVLLLVWAETGIFGLMFLVGLIVYLIIFNFHWSSQYKQFLIFKQFSINKFSKPSLEIGNWKLEIGQIISGNQMGINLSILVALVVLFSLDHWLFSLHFGVLFFWLVLGMIVSSERDKNSGLLLGAGLGAEKENRVPARE